MCGQFHFLTVKKMPITGTRRRICTFISEFTKFKLLPQSIAFNCLKKCVKDFTGPNIDMVSYQLELSGRFLYLQPQSHARMQYLVNQLKLFVFHHLMFMLFLCEMFNIYIIYWFLDYKNWKL